VTYEEARQWLISCALAALTEERLQDGSPNREARVNYSTDDLARAARDLVKAVEASDRQPIGW
jgi:hypothetical protein